MGEGLLGHQPLYFYVRNNNSLSLQRSWELHYLNTLDILKKYKRATLCEEAI